jgi:hypothetical protein
MSSITSWYRLEPRSRTDLEQRTLEARVHDPLWMLTRQWQFGELKGEDAGSPIGARLRGRYTVATRYFAGSLPVADFSAVKRYDASIPLETLVERERVQETEDLAETFDISFESGSQFLRMLGATLAAKYRAAFLATHPFPVLSEVERDAMDGASLQTYDLLRPRAINGASLYLELQAALRPVGGGPGSLPGSPVIDGADQPAVIAAADAWLDWHDALFSQPHAENPSWQRERLEYAFALSDESASGQFVLSAAEYHGGHLDWHSFDLNPNASLLEPGEPGTNKAEKVVAQLIPAPVEYPGMPSARWWEFEEARVNFGAVDAGPADLARMLMIEFALIYGNDWFVIPIELPIGALFQTTSLVVTDTFGVRLLVPPSIAKQQPDHLWRMFELTGSDIKQNVFFLAPTLVQAIHGEPLEDVLFIRDEMANMAWAIERTVQGAGGARVDRISEYRKRREAKRRALEEATSLPEQPDLTLRYKLSSEVPEPWVPLIPQHADASSQSVRLRRGALLLADGSKQTVTAQGRILDGEALSLYEEEVPREGARVTRSYQHTRWTDGSTLLWIGRKKQTGKGEGSSGLRFDYIETNMRS